MQKVIGDIDPYDSTQECGSCHNVKEGKNRLTLKDRIYDCHNCGHREDRDTNAAKIILYRARWGYSRSHAQGENVRPQQEATPEELRTDKTHPLLDAVIA